MPMQKGVQILEAHDAALVPFAHTFVIHANDAEFPRRAGTGGVFLDEERVALSKAGLPVSHREEGLRRERSLWRAVTLGDDVRISYRTTDPAGHSIAAVVNGSGSRSIKGDPAYPGATSTGW